MLEVGNSKHPGTAMFKIAQNMIKKWLLVLCQTKPLCRYFSLFGLLDAGNIVEWN